MKIHFLQIDSHKYPHHTKIFTDASKDPRIPSTAAAVYLPANRSCTSWRLPANCEITFAELFAILKACEYAIANKVTKTIIYSDSKSSIQLLLSNQPKCYRELVMLTHHRIIHLLTSSVSFHIQWVPSHCGIKGNEIADKAAKLALKQNQVTNIPISESIIKRELNKSAYNSWANQRIASIQSTHLGRIRDNPSPQPWARSSSRTLDTALTRLRIGHSGLNQHLHRIGILLSPSCSWCGEEETIRHAILHCVRHHSARSELQERLRTLHVPLNIRNILGGGSFSKEINTKVLRLFKVFLRKSALLGHL